MAEGAAFSIVRTLLALIGVCALAWVTLSLLARRGLFVTRAGARVQVLERVALSARKQLYLIQADGRVFLLAAGERGAPQLIAELAPAAPTPPLPPPPAAITQVGG